MSMFRGVFSEEAQQPVPEAVENGDGGTEGAEDSAQSPGHVAAPGRETDVGASSFIFTCS